MRNYILVVGRPKSGKLRLIKALTDELPEDIPSDSHAGLRHELKIRTRYYNADVNIWVDELEPADGKITNWVNEFTSDTAKQVRDVIGVVIHTLDPNTLGAEHILSEVEAMSEFTDLLDLEGENEETPGEILKLLLTHGPIDLTDELEGVLLEKGIEHVDMTEKSTEPALRTGIDRVKEAIEAYEWVEFPQPSGENDPGTTNTTTEQHEEDHDPATALLEDHVEDYEKLVKRVTDAKQNAANLTEDDKKKLYDDISQLVERLL